MKFQGKNWYASMSLDLKHLEINLNGVELLGNFGRWINSVNYPVRKSSLAVISPS